MRLFAYSNFREYKKSSTKYLELKPLQLKKLKMISIVDATHKSKVLEYQDLMQQLDIGSLRELEDLIIDCIYNELVEGKLDQLNQKFHVVSC